MSERLHISLSPHFHTKRTAAWCMWQVSLALLPATCCALWYFGLGAAITIAVSIASCMGWEWVINRFMLRRKATLPNGSAFLTGLLLALNLPSNLPWWIVVIGSLVAIGIGKMAFGGLGCNIFNPALVGRVFLLLSFPAQMTTWPLPIVNRLAYTDAITGATTLGRIKEGGGEAAALASNFFGEVGGSMGEIAAFALLLGFVWLLCMRVISWHIPVSIMASVALFSLCIGVDPIVQLLSGGLLLGAIFMATDYVTSPMTRSGMLFYGVMIGVITVVIRQWGAYPEGVSFAILLMNGVTPLINRYFKPRRYGERSAA